MLQRKPDMAMAINVVRTQLSIIPRASEGSHLRGVRDATWVGRLLRHCEVPRRLRDSG